MVVWLERRFTWVLWLALSSGCSMAQEPTDAGPSTAARWAAARALWHIDRDPSAHRAWTEIDAGSQEGREARRLLSEAEPHYRRGIERVRRGDPAARESFEEAVRIAPMDPVLYLPLARAFRDQGRRAPDNPHLFIRAAEYYRKFLALVPHHPATTDARLELAAIDPDGSRLFAPPPERPGSLEEPLPRAEAVATWPLWVAFAALVLAVAAVGLLLLRSRVRLESLSSLAARRPELHPAITYLVGSLRHELLKHRIGAVGNAVDALSEGRASPTQLEFLRGRLYGGEPLLAAWEGHLTAFERALGPDVDVRRSDGFREAAHAIRAIAKLEPKIKSGEPRAVRKLAIAHGALRSLDRHLSELSRQLVRTSVDGALFRDVVDAVRGEYAAGQVALDEVVLRAPEPAPLVEVFRVDLVLVLKNVVRNAILAVGGEEPPRRIGLHVTTEVEVTGEETVRIHVSDTCAQALTTEDIYARRMSRGLGLVTAALSRYDGSILVEPAEGEFAKSVVVRFFRAYADDE